jgi:putative phosphoribosyl transferase
VDVEVGPFVLRGDLVLPRAGRGLVLFAHGSGSSRHSPRNRFVAGVLQESGLGTLLLDLLTADEEVVDASTRRLRFDIPLLADRLEAATLWVRRQPWGVEMPLAYFGASTGAAAALVAAARDDGRIRAVVSRGGRPDLAGRWLPSVRAPTRLIVGSEDREVLELNRLALERMRPGNDLVVVPGATHLFEEEGALERVARLATEWFLLHLPE